MNNSIVSVDLQYNQISGMALEAFVEDFLLKNWRLQEMLIEQEDRAAAKLTASSKNLTKEKGN